MEKFLEKLFDFNKIPAKLILLLWLSAAFILFAPPNFLSRLNLSEFLAEYGKFIGITFILGSAFLLVTLTSYFIKKIRRRKLIRRMKLSILEELQYLGFHEKALLREFYINGKDIMELPFDDDTVIGLVNKKVLYQASNFGFPKREGIFFTYGITKFAKENLTYNTIDLPEKPTDADIQKLQSERPDWAINKEERNRRNSW